MFSNNEQTYLIDNCGNVVNSWSSSYKTGHGMYLLENGDLLRAGSLPGSYDAGGRGGIFELYDWAGNLKWFFLLATEERHAHHDIVILPNGNFLCTVWERKTEEEAQAVGRKYNGEVWSEAILEIEIQENNRAEIVWEWSIWDHLIQDHDATKASFGVVRDHPELLNINGIGEGQESSGNWLHINAIDYNESLDQIVISSRNLSEIYVLDHSTSTEEAASHRGGTLGKGGDILYRYGNPQMYNRGDSSDQVIHGQHDVHWIDEGLTHAGNFIVFNNEYDPMNFSRIQIFNSPVDAMGNYTFDENELFGDDTLIATYSFDHLYSDIMSAAQILPNGNILVTEGATGHIFEFTPEGKTVWDYIYPVNRNGGPAVQGGTTRFNAVFRAHRYAPDFNGFDGKELIARVPIELSPIDIGCMITDATTTATADIENGEIDISIGPNPVSDFVYVNFNHFHNSNLNFEIYSINGELIDSGQLGLKNERIELNGLIQGLYVLRLIEDRKTIFLKKMVKI